MERLDELLNKLEQVLQKDQKVNTVKEVIKQLIQQGVLEERVLREEIGFDEDTGKAKTTVAGVDTHAEFGFAPCIMEKMKSLQRHLGKRILLVVECPRTSLHGDEQEDCFQKTRQKLEKLGWQIATWVDEDGGKNIEARYELLKCGEAVAYLQIEDWYYPDC
jgi:hypothetical protein